MATARGIRKAASEDAFIQKLVLAEEIQGAIHDRRSREDQIELAHGPKLVKRLCDAFRLRILDLAAFHRRTIMFAAT